MLVFAVTLHNIPEGLAVGLAFAVAADTGGDAVTLASAIALAIGMALQNIPEGAAISLPLKKEGLSNGKAFLWGALSGAVEPIAAVIGVLLIGGRNDLRGGRGADSRGAFGRAFALRYSGRYGRLHYHDDFRRGPGINPNLKTGPQDAETPMAFPIPQAGFVYSAWFSIFSLD